MRIRGNGDYSSYTPRLYHIMKKFYFSHNSGAGKFTNASKDWEMKQCTIFHVSDLHITGNNASLHELRNKLVSLSDSYPAPRIIVATGDIVDHPTKSALKVASEFFSELKREKFEILLVPGNHDRKSLWGNFFLTNRFTRNLKTELFKTKNYPNLLTLAGIDSNQSFFAKGRISSNEYDELVSAFSLPKEDELRVAALHHHPIPMAEGESANPDSPISDEDYMYLKRPASFLRGCLESHVSIVLHGHRHVSGVTRYSTVDEHSPTGTAPDDLVYGRDLVVIACPSSTYKGKKQGFNVIECAVDNDVTIVDVQRFSRRHEHGFQTPRKPIRFRFCRKVERKDSWAVSALQACFRAENYRPERKTLGSFDDEVVDAYFSSGVHDPLEKLVGGPFALYVTAVVNGQLKIVNTRVPGSHKSSMSALIQQTGRCPEAYNEQRFEQDECEAIKKPRFGHWLIADESKPIRQHPPIAVILEYLSGKDASLAVKCRHVDFQANFKHKKHEDHTVIWFGFPADRSRWPDDLPSLRNSKFYETARTCFPWEVAKLAEVLLHNRDGILDYMGIDIKHVIQIPIYGEVAMNVQILPYAQNTYTFDLFTLSMLRQCACRLINNIRGV